LGGARGVWGLWSFCMRECGFRFGFFLHILARVWLWILLLIFFDRGGVLALWGSFCICFRKLYVGFYCYFSLTPVRGGTYFLCCAKESKQRKALHTANSEVSTSRVLPEWTERLHALPTSTVV
jgi:hypothetical protein